MALSVDDIKAKFPTKALPVVVGKPTYENIRVLTEALYGNAASLHAYTGGGKHGHVGLIMPAKLYETHHSVLPHTHSCRHSSHTRHNPSLERQSAPYQKTYKSATSNLKPSNN